MEQGQYKLFISHFHIHPYLISLSSHFKTMNDKKAYYTTISLKCFTESKHSDSLYLLPGCEKVVTELAQVTSSGMGTRACCNAKPIYESRTSSEGTEMYYFFLFD